MSRYNKINFYSFLMIRYSLGHEIREIEETIISVRGPMRLVWRCLIRLEDFLNNGNHANLAWWNLFNLIFILLIFWFNHQN